MNQKYREEPPEGGWGILICIGMALPFISALGSMPSFGLLFGEFLHNIGEGTSAIAVITSSFFSALSFSGLFANFLFKKYSIRFIALIGGILYFLGSVMQIFVTSTAALLVAYSLMQGSAFGLIVPACYTTFNSYFIKRRVTMMSLTQTLIGLGIMFYPVAIHNLMELYGFRGCLAVLAAINGHSVLGMLLMHPVKWHTRKVLITEEELPELKKNLDETKTENGEKDDDENLEKDDTLESMIPLPDKHKTPNISMDNLNYKTLNGKVSRRASSIASLGNWTGAVVVSDASERPKKRNGKWKLVVDFLDLSLLKKPVYVNIVLGVSFALYSDIAFFTLQPMYLFSLNYSQPDTATIIAIGAGADLLSRVFLAFGSAFITVPSRHVYLAGAFFTVIARFAFLTVFEFTEMAIMTAIMGFLRTWVHVPLPLVFSEYLSPERFPSGYGLFMFLQGNIMFLIGPIVGLIRDHTQDYVLTFHVLNAFMALCAIPWLFEICYVKFIKSPKSINAATTPEIP